MGSFLPESIDVAAGLVFVYLFMSILATIGREAFEGFVRARSRHLENGLIELLCDHPPVGGSKGKAAIGGYDMLKGFYDHPLIMSLYRGRYTIPPKRKPLGGRGLPSYIPSGHFAYVVLDLLAEAGGQTSSGTLDINTILAAAENLDNRRLAKMIQFAVNNSGGDVDKARQFLESWFNATMDRVSGWYRRETQTILFWISLIACVVLNVNTVVIADSLYRSPSLRKTLEAQAEAYYNGKPSAIDSLTTTRPVAQDAAASVDAAPATPPVASSVPAPANIPVPVTTTSTSTVPSAVTPPANQLDKAPPAATLVTGGDIPGLLSKTDPLEKLGLPLGWNSQTITAMHRLFPAAPQVSAAEAEHLNQLRSMNIKAKDPVEWISIWFGHVGQVWQDTVKAYETNDQDPASNALFNAAGTLSLIGGWLMTAFAVTLGAPFWFDILSKLMMVRSTMKPGDKGSSDMAGLSAIAAALAGPPDGNGGGGGGTKTAFLPNFSSVGADTAASGDLVHTLDPNSRPRDP
ncbi:hypothetical protein [Asticcacaulis solisilvae]|uniref:hypothetical protein n=1 Tax=Asticcacaulis solisilvae TaxID=1217274 RepID=UPI003FD71E18